MTLSSAGVWGALVAIGLLYVLAEVGLALGWKKLWRKRPEDSRRERRFPWTDRTGT